jgi:hypothetical protein
MTGRLLITGSRDWTDDDDTIRHALAMRYQPDIVLVQGGARGADTIAAVIWRVFGGEVETHRADWDQHGNGAGHIRNKLMVDLGADECLAFIRNQSAGATGCAALAEKAGIPTKRWEQP